jgi:hypothetical protein
LENRHLHRLILHHKNPPIGPAIPAIHQIMRTAAQHPDGQVKAKRRHRLQLKGCFWQWRTLRALEPDGQDLVY